MYLEALFTVSFCQNNSVPTTHLIATSRFSPICKWSFQSGSFLNKPKYPKTLRPETRVAMQEIEFLLHLQGYTQVPSDPY